MAITVCGSCVEFGSFTMCDTSPGFSFNGVIKAECGFCDFISQAQGTVSGYTSGGPDVNGTIIDKFPFATDTNATDVGDLTQNRRHSAGQSSTVSGYTSGGIGHPPGLGKFNTIDKFPFAVDANATDVGDLTRQVNGATGQTSAVSGYTSGGSPPIGAPGFNIIDKFPFATDANATNVSDLTQGRYALAGQSSTVSGYSSGGQLTKLNTIDKFPFASDLDATDVGDLTVSRQGGAGQSSTVSGYTSGGLPPAGGTTIDKFPFASDANATDVGELTQSRLGAAGQQV